MSEHEEVASDARRRAMEMGVRPEMQRQGSLPREIEDIRRDVDLYDRGRFYFYTYFI